MVEDKTAVIAGKLYISSKRAAQEFAYTKDYIGQLCRSGKVKSVMFGRDRLVDNESLATYAKLKEKKDTASAAQPDISQSSERRDNRVPEQTTLKEIPIRKPISLRRVPGSRVKSGLSLLVAMCVFGVGILLISVDRMAAVSSYSYERYLGGELGNFFDDGDIKSSAASLSQTVDEKYLGYLSSIEADLLRGGKIMRASLLKLFGGSSKTSTHTLVTELDSTGGRSVSNDSSNDARGEVTQSPRKAERNQRSGIVTLPAGPSEVPSQTLVDQVRGSFSDEVAISFDDSGTAGVIRPVFRSTSDERYMFVLLGINENK